MVRTIKPSNIIIMFFIYLTSLDGLLRENYAIVFILTPEGINDVFFKDITAQLLPPQ